MKQKNILILEVVIWAKEAQLYQTDSLLAALMICGAGDGIRQILQTAILELG